MPYRGTSRLTVAGGADAATVEAVHRAALLVLRPRLVHLDVDVVSDEPWPEDVVWAVDAAEPYCVRRHWWRRRPTRAITARIDPDDDTGFAVAVALVPHTIGATGVARGVAYRAHDTGRALVVDLTAAEADRARELVREQGGDPDRLTAYVPPPRRRRRLLGGPLTERGTSRSRRTPL